MGRGLCRPVREQERFVHRGVLRYKMGTRKNRNDCAGFPGGGRFSRLGEVVRRGKRTLYRLEDGIPGKEMV